MDLNLDINTLFTLLGFVLTAAALYWKVRIDITKIDLKIAEIQCDRKERWSKYSEDKDKSEAYFGEILRNMGEMNGDIKTIKNELAWLRDGHLLKK